MRGSKISLMGLYQYDHTLLDDLHLPEEINADDLKNRLLIESSEFEVLYPTPDWMKMALDSYSATRLHAWEIMAKVLMKKEYDPFTNVNRHEERTETESRDLKGTANNSSTGQVSAYNVSTFSNQNKVLNEGESTDTGTVTRRMVYDLQGDSAISDTQDLIQKELNLRRSYDLYSIIISDIIHNVCIMVY